MIHPASIACAKPDLRYQRSFTSGCRRGESTLVASGLSRKPTWDRQHHLALVRVLEADWRRTFPSALPKYRLGRMNLDEWIPQSTPSFIFLKKSFGVQKAPPDTFRRCKKKSPANSDFIGIGGRCENRSFFTLSAEADSDWIGGLRLPAGLAGIKELHDHLKGDGEH